MLEQTFPLLNEAEQDQVVDALSAYNDGRSSPLGRWLRDLRQGLSRLPELPSETMKRVVLSWFQPDVDGAPVCNRCGLEYPDLKSPPTSTWKLLPGKVPFQGPPPWYDLPRLFDACPCCGASAYDTTWSHLTEGKDLAWKKLDGWLGAVTNGHR
jgi:hypothetical protein